MSGVRVIVEGLQEILVWSAFLGAGVCCIALHSTWRKKGCYAGKLCFFVSAFYMVGLLTLRLSGQRLHELTLGAAFILSLMGVYQLREYEKRNKKKKIRYMETGVHKLSA